MDGKCRTMNTVYKCIASVPTKPDKSYVRLFEDKWKKPYYNHRKNVSKPTLSIGDNAIQLCMGIKTCYRPNAIPEMVNHYSFTSLLKYHETLSTFSYEKYAVITYPGSENLLNKRSEVPPPTKVFIE